MPNPHEKPVKNVRITYKETISRGFTPIKLRRIALVIASFSFLSALLIVVAIGTFDWIVLSTGYISTQPLELRYGLFRNTEAGSTPMYFECYQKNDACGKLFVAGMATISLLVLALVFAFCSFTGGVALHLELFGTGRMARQGIISSSITLFFELTAIIVWSVNASKIWNGIKGARPGFSFFLALGALLSSLVVLVCSIVSDRWARIYEREFLDQVKPARSKGAGPHAVVHINPAPARTSAPSSAAYIPSTAHPVGHVLPASEQAGRNGEGAFVHSEEHTVVGFHRQVEEDEGASYVLDLERRLALDLGPEEGFASVAAPVLVIEDVETYRGLNPHSLATYS